MFNSSDICFNGVLVLTKAKILEFLNLLLKNTLLTNKLE